MRSVAALALSVVALTSCLTVTPAGTLIASTPSGARILVDGRDSGLVTPREIQLEKGRSHRIVLELAGFALSTLELDEGRRVTLVGWNQAGIRPIRFPLPIFHSSKELFLPVRVDRSSSPWRIHVRLRPLEASAP